MHDAPRDEDAAAGTPAPAGDAAQQRRSSDVAMTDEEHGTAEPELDPRRAYQVLEIRTPLEEFDSYVRARIDTLSRLGETDKAELASQALELGRRALARVTGTTVPDKQEKSPR